MADLLRLTACSRVSRFDIFNCSDFFDFPSSVPRKINDLRTRGFGLCLALSSSEGKKAMLNALGRS